MNPALLPELDGEDNPGPPKRQRTSYANTDNNLLYGRYTIAWFCALYIDTVAALAMLDEIHGELPRPSSDIAYTLGSIKNHHVVIACSSQLQYGHRDVTSLLTIMRHTFPSIRHGLIVGTGGGAPSKLNIRLGDIVVGTEVMHYADAEIPNGSVIQRTAIPEYPGDSLCMAATSLRARHELYPTRVPAILQDRMQGHIEYHRPSTPDHLFQASYEHDLSMANCQTCDQSRPEWRDARRSCAPKVHYSAIAPNDQIMKETVTRGHLAQKSDIDCFEVKAERLMNIFPCLLIRGICDCSDSHKAENWRKYAAAAAAAYSRELLDILPATGDASRDSWPKPPESEAAGSHRRQLLESLKFEQIDARKTEIETSCYKTCHWILKHPDYLSWLDTEKKSQHRGFLWIRGKPGAGKSTIMKFIYTQMKKTDIPIKALTISFFFNAAGELLEKSVSGMYRALLLQLLEGFPDLQKILDGPDMISWDQTACPSLNILKDLFRSAIAYLDNRALACFVDALDECDAQQVKDMVEFFEEVAEQCAQDNMRFKVCFSSRHAPYLDVKSGIRLILEGQDGHNDDLDCYTTRYLRIKDAGLKEKVKKTVLEKAAGDFLRVTQVVRIVNDYRRYSKFDKWYNGILGGFGLCRRNVTLSLKVVVSALEPAERGQYINATMGAILDNILLRDGVAIGYQHLRWYRSYRWSEGQLLYAGRARGTVDARSFRSFDTELSPWHPGN
ncbi:hypothetical protein FANTH_209 [Fusarium anthophilum]|uniref:Nephrocystin 3-like N-terminal domain-containing protein n=1 Tax=Fusarium anthophilum TaxID=48485 RepID=A0A8H4ZYK5_9HYPO|nr:hypothetical protein FANTH_209 [Fusarium anthophilum]